MHVCRERTRRALCLYPCVYWLAVLCFLFVCARVVSCGDFVASCPQKLVFVLQPIENIANAANSQHATPMAACARRRQASDGSSHVVSIRRSTMDWLCFNGLATEPATDGMSSQLVSPLRSSLRAAAKSPPASSNASSCAMKPLLMHCDGRTAVMASRAACSSHPSASMRYATMMAGDRDLPALLWRGKTHERTSQREVAGPACAEAQLHAPMNEDARVVPAAAAYERRRHREHGVQILELTVSHVYGHVLECARVGVLDVGQVEDVRHTSASAVTQPRERATSRRATSTRRATYAAWRASTLNAALNAPR